MSPSRATGRAATTRSWGAELLRVVWQIPLFSLGLAMAMVMLTGSPWATLRGFYLPVVVCTGLAMLALVVLRQTVQPRLIARFDGDPRGGWVIAVFYMVTSLVATAFGVVLLKFTLVPGILSSTREAVQMLSYSLVLAMLTTGIALSYSYYRRAVDRAGSDRELQLARRIQRSFLLTEFPVRARLEVHAENLSSREVSGDFYDVVRAGGDALLLAVADVSGKGVPAALLSSMMQASLRTLAAPNVSPAAIMTAINRLACGRGQTGQFATVFIATIDEPTLILRYTNAGHNHPVLLRVGGTRELLERGGLVVGMLENVAYEEGVTTLAPGDRLVIYTDGVTEAARADGEMCGEARLYELLAALPPALDSRAAVTRVLDGVRGFLAGVEAGDDITVLVLRVLPEAGHAR